MSKLKISRKNFIDNPVVVVDGPPGSGKGIISRLLPYFQNVETFREKTEFEVLCSLYSIHGIDLESAKFFIQAISDQDIYHQSILRHANVKPGELSSITKFPRKLEYIKRFFSGNLKKLEQKFLLQKKVMNYCIHNTTSCVEPIFNALQSRLIYIRVVRSPFSDYMLRLCSQWSKRWETDYKNNVPILSDSKSQSNKAPFFIPNELKELYYRKDNLNKSAMSICAWQNEGDVHLDKLRSKYDTKIIEIPFELFVTTPEIYLEEISKALNQSTNKNVLNFLKKENIPRNSLSDAPLVDYYLKNGWKKPTKIISPIDELENEAMEAKDFLDKDIYDMVLKCYRSYFARYKIDNLNK
jgi:hypothetical protein